MNIFNFLFWILACISITNIITGSSILKNFRKFIIINKNVPIFFKEMISCNQCTGFWVGVFMYILLSFVYKMDQNIFISIFLSIFLFGPIISILSDYSYRLKIFLCKDC